MQPSQLAIEAIRKKLIGKRLNYKEVYAVMDQIAKDRLGDILTTYFAASGYSKGYTEKEIYYLTKAMVATGQRLHFRGIVADKHSIGGTPGTRTTFIVVPIIAFAGFKIPKGSSRAITTPGGTADDMEVLAKVEFTADEIYKIVQRVGGCIVWGGSFNIAPADDEIIKVEEPLLFESYDKIIVSIMAKKIAFGSNHVVIDLPYGEYMKVRHVKDAERLRDKFERLAEMFKMKIRVFIHRTDQPAGRGIGPALEVREALRVLQQKEDRPLDLQERSLNLAGGLLDLCLTSRKKLKNIIVKEYGTGREWARHILESGAAWEKMREIIHAQGGKSTIDSEDVKTGKYHYTVRGKKKGTIKGINSKNVTIIARILGAPTEKGAGMYLEKKLGTHVEKDSMLCTLFAEDSHALKEAIESLPHFPVFEIA